MLYEPLILKSFLNIRFTIQCLIKSTILFQILSQEFRFEYAQLWLSILNVDRKEMRIHSHNLGIEGDLYALFTCMITGRTWDTVLTGVDKTKRTQKEVTSR